MSFLLYILHNLQGQFSETEVFIFALKPASDSIVLYLFGNIKLLIQNKYKTLITNCPLGKELSSFVSEIKRYQSYL